MPRALSARLAVVAVALAGAAACGSGGGDAGPGSTPAAPVGAQLAVPDVVDRDVGTALRTLHAAGFADVQVQRSGAATDPTATVTAMSPGAGTGASPATAIVLTAAPG